MPNMKQQTIEDLEKIATIRVLERVEKVLVAKNNLVMLEKLRDKKKEIENTLGGITN